MKPIKMQKFREQVCHKHFKQNQKIKISQLKTNRIFCAFEKFDLASRRIPEKSDFPYVMFTLSI